MVRTTCLLRRLRTEHPEAHITWVIDPDNAELLANNPLLDRVLPMSGSLSVLCAIEHFDTAFGLDHDPFGAALVTLCRAETKRGFLLSSEGKPVPADNHAAYWYQLGLSDALKFRENRKTYQEYMFEACGYVFRKETSLVQLTDAERHAVHGLWDSLSLPEHTVGINLGGSPRFAGRHWPDTHVLDLARDLTTRGVGVLLLAGPAERERAERLAAQSRGIAVLPTVTKRELAAVVERLTALVSSDTLALHLAVAMGTRAVALFGGTSWFEFEPYGLAEVLTAKLPCSPCYRSDCTDQQCMVSITPRRVLDALVQASGEVPR